MELDVRQTVDWMVKANEKVQEQKDYLSQLDRAIGDGDHGINMARGFQEIANTLPNEEFEEVSDVLKKTATIVMSKVGGASGPLYGTAFLKMSMESKGSNVDGETFEKMVGAAVEGLKQRGKAKEGEKTMIDVWSPVLDVLKEVSEINGEKIREAAHTAMEATKDMVATKGRAAYLKERSKDHLDPGSVSSYYLFEALAETLEKG
ncbi:dihydroxyacetone kinase subunit DhaL [Halobacillus mangrovi]|uniref:phosphoenolpyruvate--glycerone phosphotransferase n=1 Tax=Halobacillus mangrovi TaxID=402384 RepID=A0A1W5ZT40_9BACI|nr:dihydroxyacetone kinase subunit DhaL [Halobacillus mangrovi]ARI76421.1 dihydroxyacetone kinase subunit L [Halobacillus mangrovi]